MKMVMAVVSKYEAERVLQELVAEGFTATYTDSRGGMLRQGQQTLFIAVAKEDLERVMGIIQESCHTSMCLEPERESGLATKTTQVGNAIIFVWDLEKYEAYS